ncbi:MAG: EpsI family protein, partial [Gemmataceae bacterium]|nr:EpsI family protein [Gemmataceae bacterium]
MRVSATGPLLVAAVLIAAAGVGHGLQTDRWRPSAALSQSLERLPNLPARCGDWEGKDEPLEAEDMARAGIKGWVQRRYTNPQTRESVSVLLVCGRGGPISVHTPDVCYTGSGFKQVGDIERREVTWDAPAQRAGGAERPASVFRVAQFGKDGVIPTRLEIYWCWSRDGRTWEAPDN